jgi:hypothetical protein
MNQSHSPILGRTGTGVMAMTPTSWTRKQIAVLVAISTLACAVVFLAIGLTGPKPFASDVLNTQWQCTRTAGIITVCTKKHA